MAMSRLKIVVSDSSVVMDLAKVKLIEPVVRPPFEFVIPDVILAREPLDLGSYTAAQNQRRVHTVDHALGGRSVDRQQGFGFLHDRHGISAALQNIC